MVWKDSKSKKMTQAWTFIGQSWDVFLLVNWASAKDFATTCPATLAYAPTDAFDMFNAWKKWSTAELDIFALGITFQEIVGKKGGRALTDPFKEDFGGIIENQLLCPNQDLEQAGLQLSGQPWMWNPTSSQRNHTNHKSSHNTNHTNHIHPNHQAIAILHWWDDTAHHCCRVNLLGLGMTHIACLPPDPTVPYGTCCILYGCKDMGEGAYLR